MQISKFLSFRDKMVASFLILVFIFSFSFLGYNIYKNFTKSVPKKGGEYAEGVLGYPLYINPLLSQSSDADSDLTQLIYSGLFKFDKDGKVINDLAEKYEVSEDEKKYTVFLKKNAVWHDGVALTADDVVFTVNILQDPAYRSVLRQFWQGIEINKVDDYTVSFSLKNQYFVFLNKLTLGILPKHLWENVGPERFFLAEYNLKPVGSGPYKFSAMQKNSDGKVISYELVSFEKYYMEEPYISKFVLNFYSDEELMVLDYNNKQIKGMSNIASSKLSSIKKRAIVREISFPRYFAIFFNQNKSIPLASEEVRKALAYATDRSAIINNIFQGKAKEAFSPFLAEMKEYNNEIEKYVFNVEKANEILENSGWKMNQEKGVREKNGIELKFNIYTVDYWELSETAKFISKEWEKIGAKAEVSILTISDLQQNYIRPREYESILLGQDISFSPDPYAYWHSSQRDDPGLNISLFSDKKADELLEKAHQELDENARIEAYKEFQKIIAEKIPAVFFYSNMYLYPMNDEVKGVEINRVNFPAWRFADVNKWYIKTKRVLK